MNSHWIGLLSKKNSSLEDQITYAREKNDIRIMEKIKNIHTK